MTSQQPIELIRDVGVPMARQHLGEATSQVQYVSRGHCLIIGDTESALAAASRYDGPGSTVVTIDPQRSSVEKRLTDDGVAVFMVPSLDLQGHLGAWHARVPRDQQESFDLAVSVYRESGCFDVVLDLSAQPLMGMAMPPFGYAHVTDDEGIEPALQALAELTGEFDKPRYFHYDATLCAHSRSELEGCQRCMQVCAPEAIHADGEGIRVDPFRCQGCGSCATVCPSGAISYAYPRPADALNRTREQVRADGASVLVLHVESQQPAIEALSLDGSVLALMVEEVTAFGPDYWLSMLAAGIRHIVLLMDSAKDDPGRFAIESQQRWVAAVLSDIGIGELPVSVMSSDALSDWLSSAPNDATIADPLASLQAQSFATHNDKRQTLRLALDVLSEQLPSSGAFTGLPAGAPFGRINVDTEACTLCMACVSTCPAKALQDGQDTPALRFIEANCLQCGLCETACPESAISLEARYQWDSIEARKVRTLHEEQPFHCARCHTPFTTQRMIDTMTEKLAGHWMFQDEKAIRRLRLCGDCRVRDMFEDDAAGIEIHR